jgi:hypothetical protein
LLIIYAVKTFAALHGTGVNGGNTTSRECTVIYLSPASSSADKANITRIRVDHTLAAATDEWGTIIKGLGLSKKVII